MEPKLNSFIEVSPQSDFTIHNLPYGVLAELRKVGVKLV